MNRKTGGRGRHDRWRGIAALLSVLLVVPGVVNAEAARAEGAVAGGLQRLAETQIRSGAEAGSWAVEHANYRPAIASLAGLAFLANGHMPGDAGPYGDTVAAALQYVVRSIGADGYAGQGDRSGMYIHAISTLFALSCLGMQADETLEPALAEACRRSIEVVLRAQQVAKSSVARGGWRYTPYSEESDISVTCWQLLVLHSARQAGFSIEESVLGSGLAYLSRAYLELDAAGESGDDTQPPPGGFLYRPGISREPEPAATALAVYIKSLFDAADDRQTRGSLRYLARYQPTWGGAQYGGFFYFAGFYMVQGMFQAGGETWDAFHPRMRRVLLDHQSGDGSWPFPPDNTAQSRLTGAAYPTAMAVLMLSIDKQFLPMTQRQRRLYAGQTHLN